MDKLIELIERHRDKWQKKWSKGTQLRDSNSEHYDPFLHGESVGGTKAYNNVLQWMKDTSIMSGDKDLALTKDDVKSLIEIWMNLPDFPQRPLLQIAEETLNIFNEQRKK